MIWGHLKPTPNSTTLTDVIVGIARHAGANPVAPKTTHRTDRRGGKAIMRASVSRDAAEGRLSRIDPNTTWPQWWTNTIAARNTVWLCALHNPVTMELDHKYMQIYT